MRKFVYLSVSKLREGNTSACCLKTKKLRIQGNKNTQVEESLSLGHLVGKRWETVTGPGGGEECVREKGYVNFPADGWGERGAVEGKEKGKSCGPQTCVLEGMGGERKKANIVVVIARLSHQFLAFQDGPPVRKEIQVPGLPPPVRRKKKRLNQGGRILKRDPVK